jgi:hypothetical protein
MKHYIGARFDQVAAAVPGAAEADATSSKPSSSRLLRPVPTKGPLPATTRLRLMCPALDVFFSAVDACGRELAGQLPVVTHVVTYERSEPEEGTGIRRRHVRRVVPPSRWLFWRLSRLSGRQRCREERRRKTGAQQWRAYERW